MTAVECPTAEDTRSVAAAIAPLFRGGTRIRLFGALGAGKTEFVRGFVYGLDARIAVSSPTFALIHGYATVPPVIHADLYRIHDESEYEELDLEGEASDGVLIVEWPERAGDFLDDSDCDIVIEQPVPSEDQRILTVHCDYPEILRTVGQTAASRSFPKDSSDDC